MKWPWSKWNKYDRDVISQHPRLFCDPRRWVVTAWVEAVACGEYIFQAAEDDEVTLQYRPEDYDLLVYDTAPVFRDLRTLTVNALAYLGSLDPIARRAAIEVIEREPKKILRCSSLINQAYALGQAEGIRRGR